MKQGEPQSPASDCCSILSVALVPISEYVLCVISELTYLVDYFLSCVQQAKSRI